MRAAIATSGIIATLFAAASAACVETEVSVDGGPAPLYGTLTRPDGLKPGPAVLLIAGSGPTDRDGNSTVPGVRPDNLRQLAQALEAAGFASLRYDKRGIAKSAPAALREEDLRFTTAVDDAVAFARFLERQPQVRCVVIAGHSEGALVAAMAAQKTPTCGVIQIAGAGRPYGIGIREQLSHQLPPQLLAQADRALAELEAGRTTPGVPGLEALFRPSVQPYLISQLTIDPAAELRAAKAPVLIVQGDRDLQVSVDDARKLAAARPDATLIIAPEVNHVLKAAPPDRAGNFATYGDPGLPLSPVVTDAVVRFIRGAKAATP